MRKPHDYTVFSALAGILASLTDLVSMVMFGVCSLDYNSLKDTVSSLGASVSPVSAQISTIWIIVGVLLIFFGIGFYREFSEKGRSARIASWMIILYGFGEGIGSGIFKADRIATGLTITGVFHEMLGGLGIISIIFLPLIMRKVIPAKENPAFQVLSMFVFVSGVILILLFLFRYSANETNFFSVYKGLWQRLFILITYIYLLSIAVLMIKRHQKQTER